MKGNAPQTWETNDLELSYCSEILESEKVTAVVENCTASNIMLLQNMKENLFPSQIQDIRRIKGGLNILHLK